jgi:aldose 1-epimerase
MKQEFFGKTADGTPVFKYEISSKELRLIVTNYGARITRLLCDGVDVVLGFDDFSSYLSDVYSFGAVIGRVANRIENGEIVIDGQSYSLTKNQNGNCLHGGAGFQYKVWTPISQSENEITFKINSPDGDNGFPGNMTAYVTYTLLGGALIISYRAKVDKKSPISLTNHAYFNLNGKGDVLSHRLKIYSKSYTEVDARLIPTGNHKSVSDTPYDFSKARPIGQNPIEYDLNYLLMPSEDKAFNDKRLPLAAICDGEKIRLKVYTDRPCLQLYTPIYSGAYFPSLRNNTPRKSYEAFCLEAQIEPNSVKYGTGIYGAGKLYEQNTVYEFEVIK